MSRKEDERLLSQQEFWILESLKQGPKHGYAIAKEVEQMTEGRLRLGAATLYDNIGRLLDGGMINPHEESIVNGRARKTYLINDDGGRALENDWNIYDRRRLVRIDNQPEPV